MDLHSRIDAFIRLGRHLVTLSPIELEQLADKAIGNNPWFTKQSVAQALTGIEKYLSEDKLNQWIQPYRFDQNKPLTIGVVMAGNIPLVGFHDFLSILLTGNVLQAKFSSSDKVLMDWITDTLLSLEPRFEHAIQRVNQIEGVHAVIATGSDNSSRYFEYNFSGLPVLIRKNRSSCAILKGNESKSDYVNLGKDIFQYYGLGCRNASKIHIPKKFQMGKLINGLSAYEEVLTNTEYADNYHYNAAIYQLNEVPVNDTGFVLFKKAEQVVSPIGVVYVQEYSNASELEHQLESSKHQIQCIVSKDAWYPGSMQFGEAQAPELWDYADGRDTLEFILSLN